jgi:hypothetical protein
MSLNIPVKQLSFPHLLGQPLSSSFTAYFSSLGNQCSLLQYLNKNCKYIGEKNLREQTKHCKGENLTRGFQPAFYFEDNWIYLDQELVRTLLLT